MIMIHILTRICIDFTLPSVLNPQLQDCKTRPKNDEISIQAALMEHWVSLSSHWRTKLGLEEKDEHMFVREVMSCATQASTWSLINDTALQLTLPMTLQCLSIMYLPTCANRLTHHMCAHTLTFTHEPAEGYSPHRVLRPGRPDEAKGGLCVCVYVRVCVCVCVWWGGVSESSNYLSLSMSISVGPIPPSAVALSPQASHASPPPHVIVIRAAKYTLPAFLPLWQFKTKV